MADFSTAGVDDVLLAAQGTLSDRDLARLSAAERRRFDSLTPPRAAAFARGRALLRGGGVDVLPAVCPRCGGAHGRPVGVGREVSIAHTGDWSVVAHAPTGIRIGVDTERLDESRGADVARLLGLAADPVAALWRWTAVEAVLKADGRGLEVEPAAVRVEGDAATVAGSSAVYRLHRFENLVPGAATTLAIRAG